jgi:hypothetical protein
MASPLRKFRLSTIVGERLRIEQVVAVFRTFRLNYRLNYRLNSTLRGEFVPLIQDCQLRGAYIMSLLTIGRGPASYNYYVLRGVLDETIIEEMQGVAAELPRQGGGVYSHSSANTMFAYLDRMPALVKKLPQLLDGIHCVGTNFFCSDPTDPKMDSHGEWHTGHSLYFGVGGVSMTMWIPLQDIDEKTGGRLKIYNGEHIAEIDDLLQCQVKKTGNSISNKHSLLQYLNHELEADYQIEDMKVGDVLLFDEMLPHQAEKCNIRREVMALRLIVGDYTLNKPLIQEVIDRYDTTPGEINHASEYLENLIQYNEYDLHDNRSPDDPPREAMPISVGRRAMLDRVLKRFIPGS